jgi:hypothetical protein
MALHEEWGAARGSTLPGELGAVLRQMERIVSASVIGQNTFCVYDCDAAV